MSVRKAIIKRCESDTNTKLRLKYQPYYQNVTAANGVNIVVAGKPKRAQTPSVDGNLQSSYNLPAWQLKNDLLIHVARSGGISAANGCGWG